MIRLGLLILIGWLCSTSAYAQDLTNASVSYLLNLNASSSISNELEAIRAEQSMSMRNLGLYASASYTRRSGGNFLDPNDELSFGRTFYNVGIDWDILKNGWYQYRNNAYEKEIEYRLAALSQYGAQKQEAYYLQFALLGYIFESEKSNVYLRRTQDLNTQISQSGALFDLGYIRRENVLELQNRLANTQLINRNNSFAIRAFEETFDVSQFDFALLSQIPDQSVHSIDISRLLQAIDEKSYLNEVVDTKRQLIERRFDWKNDVRLTASLDYNKQESLAGNGREFSSFRLAVQVPIRFNKHAQKRLRLAEIDGFQDDLSYDLLNRKKEALTLYKEYVYKQKQIQYAHKTKSILEERMRVQTVLMESVDLDVQDEYSLLLLDDMHSIDIEILDLKHQLYKILLKMNLLIPEGSIEDYLFLEKEFDWLEYSRRGIVIDANADYKQAPLFYAQFLESQSIDAAFIKATYSNSYKPLAAALEKKQIPTFLIVEVINSDMLDMKVLLTLNGIAESSGLNGIAIYVPSEIEGSLAEEVRQFLDRLAGDQVSIPVLVDHVAYADEFKGIIYVHESIERSTGTYVDAKLQLIDSWIDNEFKTKGGGQ